MGKDKSNTANLLRAVAREGEKLQASKRRNFLKQGLLLAGAALSGAAVPGTVLAGDNNLPPNVPPLDQVAGIWRAHQSLWQALSLREPHRAKKRSVADGGAHCVNQFYTASRIERHHNAEQPGLRTLSCRRSGNRSGTAPAHDSRHGRSTHHSQR